MSKLRSWKTPSTLIFCLFLLGAGSAAVAQQGESRPAPVVTDIVEEGSVAQAIRLTGNVQPLFSTQIRAEQAGLVETLHVDVGDYVTTGTVLLEQRRLPFELEVAQAEATLARRKAELEELEAGTRSEDISISRAALEENQAELDTAREEYERYETLFEDGSVSKSEYDERRLRFRRAQAEVQSARAQLERDEAGPRPEIIAAARADYHAAESELELALDQLDNSIIKAPFAGTITERHVGPGGYINVGDSIIRLEYIDEVKIELSVPETYFGRVPLGTSFEIGLEAYPEERFVGRVYQRVYRADLRSRSFPVNVIVENSKRRIAPGMLARARLRSAVDGEKSMLVSRDALVASQHGPYVVRVKRDEAGDPFAEIINVETGRFFGEYVEVFGDLRPNDQIVIRGNERLQPDQPLSLNTFVTDPQSARVLDPSGFFDERDN